MVTMELETPRLRRQVINRVQNFDYKTLVDLLAYMDLYEYSGHDNYVDVGLHFQTPTTSEEAVKEMEEIDAEIKAGKYVTYDDGMAEIDKMINEYENCLV